MNLLKYRNGVFTALFLILSVIAGATTIPVNSAAEISNALDNIQPGDTLLMLNGYWTDQVIHLRGEGTAEAPIVLKAVTPGLVILNGTSRLRIRGNWLVVDGLYFNEGYSPSGAVIEFRDGAFAYNCRLTRTVIRNYNPTSTGTDYKWVSLYGQYNRVDHCHFVGKLHSGTTLVVWMDAIPDYHRIDHNWFGWRPDFGANGAETIRIGTSAWSMYDANCIVEDNLFEECNGEIEIISNKSCGNVYRRNTFRRNEGTLTLRHGNRCQVYQNFFLGDGQSGSGGVRVIGEDHQVFNNYFQDLEGDGYRSAITLVNGVPNSPLNRYFQVKRAEIAFNTIVNCNASFTIGAGASDEQSLPPLDCTIANNAVFSDDPYDFLVEYEDEPLNLQYQGNIMLGSDLGIPMPDSGIAWLDPQLELSSDGLYRPAAGSPLIDAALGEYPEVQDDLDGQTRTIPFDVGADESSADPILIRPLTSDDVGPDWWPAPPPPDRIRYVAAGLDSLRLAVADARAGDILVLTTSGGEYDNSESILVDKDLIIRTADSLDSPPRILNHGSIGPAAIFTLATDADLVVEGLVLEGSHPFEQWRILFTIADTFDRLELRDCELYRSGSVMIDLPAGTFMDSLILEDCLISQLAGDGIRFDGETEGSGDFNVNTIQISRSTIWDVAGAFLRGYGGDAVPFTPSPEVRLEALTLDRVGTSVEQALVLRDLDFVFASNLIVTRSPAPIFATFYGATAEMDYSVYDSIGIFQYERGAYARGHTLESDPLYMDADEGDFTLAMDSPAWYWGVGGSHPGDPRWHDQAPVSITPGEAVLPSRFATAYPNPFNPATVIVYEQSTPGDILVQVLDLRGRRVATPWQGWSGKGLHRLRWQPEELPGGVYLLDLQLPEARQSLKLLYLK